MPTYEYKCDACGHAFEQFHSMSAAPIRKCPECKKLKVKRLIGTGAGLIFKGSGFYITDYRDQSYKDKAKADSGDGATKDATTTPAGGDGKAAGTEAKPAAAADAKPAAAGATPAPAAAPPASAAAPANKSARKDSAKKSK